MRKNVVVIGSSGHAKVVADIIESAGDYCIGFLDKNNVANTKVVGKDIIGDDSCIPRLCQDDVLFILGIGSNQIRKQLDEQYPDIRWYTAIHPSSFVSKYAEIGVGTVIMPKAVVATEARIGRHCIINSGAVVEHEDRLENYVHISPNASLAGRVYVGEGTQIGIGSSIREGIKICSNVIVGAGGVVVKDILISGKYVGVPVHYME